MTQLRDDAPLTREQAERLYMQLQYLKIWYAIKVKVNSDDKKDMR